MQFAQGLLLALVAPASVVAYAPYYAPYNQGHPIRPSDTAPYYPTGTGTAPYYPSGTASYHLTGTTPTYPTGTAGTATRVGYVYHTAALKRVARRVEMMEGRWA